MKTKRCKTKPEKKKTGENNRDLTQKKQNEIIFLLYPGQNESFCQKHLKLIKKIKTIQKINLRANNKKHAKRL